MTIIKTKYSRSEWFDMHPCPVCGEKSLAFGETVDVGFGDGPYGVKAGPDHCENCGYIEQGPDPTDKPISYYKECWAKKISPKENLPELKRAPIKQEYEDWIKNNVEGDGYGKCRQICAEMVRAFPELRRVYGAFFDAIWGERAHFWLIDPDNNIVDPTKNQFPGGGFYQMDRFYPVELDNILHANEI